MADSPISGLPETTTVGDNDLLLLEQGNEAKKIKGENWKQYFNANVVGVTTNVIQPNVAPSATYDQATRILTLNLPSSDYIQSVSKTSTSGLVDTYTLTTKLGYTATFTVTNAKSITSVTKTSGNHNPGTLDTYRIAFNDNSHTDYQVYNGADGTGTPSTTVPLVDSGTGDIGSATTYFALADHVHPTDTSRAAQTDMTAVLTSLLQSNCADANDIDGTYQQFLKINSSTLHTPYTEGLTASTAGMLISYANSSDELYCTQIAIMTGDTRPAVRSKNNGTWGAWRFVQSVLHITSIACSATTGDFVSLSDSRISADHVLVSCVFANPNYITSDITWTTASGSLKLNGTCSQATTCAVILVQKDS